MTSHAIIAGMIHSLIGYVAAQVRRLEVGRFLVAALLWTTATGCFTPEPVLRMTPLSDNLLWVNGLAAVVEEGKLARAGVAFVRPEQDLVGFHVEIENTSMAPILVDPSRFYYAACTSAEAGNTRKCQRSRWAVDPEKVLLDLDIAHSRQVASQANKEALASAFILLDMAAATAGTTHKKPALTGAAIAHSVQMSDTISGIEAESDQHAVAYEAQRGRWENVALRKTTLLPGNRMSGMVYVPRAREADEVRLHLRLGSEVMVFPFKQVLIDARRPRRKASERFPDRDWRGR